MRSTYNVVPAQPAREWWSECPMHEFPARIRDLPLDELNTLRTQLGAAKSMCGIVGNDTTEPRERRRVALRACGFLQQKIGAVTAAIADRLKLKPNRELSIVPRNDGLGVTVFKGAGAINLTWAEIDQLRAMLGARAISPPHP